MSKPIKGLGEIVSWTSPRSVKFETLQDAMTKAGIDPETAKEMRPVGAFRRAAKDLEKNRVIREIRSTRDAVFFQFTSETLNGREYDYATEAVLEVDKTTGVVKCDNAELRVLAKTLLDGHIAVRNASDITRIVKSLFECSGDLFPLRDAGGVYFVPQVHVAICESVEILLDNIGGGISRWEMNSSHRNNKGVADSVSQAIEGMVDEYKVYAEGLKKDDPKTKSRSMKRINMIRGKLEAYKDILADQGDTIRDSINEITNDVRGIICGPVVRAEKRAEEPVADAALSIF